MIFIYIYNDGLKPNPIVHLCLCYCQLVDELPHMGDNSAVHRIAIWTFSGVPCCLTTGSTPNLTNVIAKWQL